MDNEILKYLTDDEKKKIASRVYEEEIRTRILSDIDSKSSDIFYDFHTVYERILEEYINKLNLVKMDFITAIEATLKKEISKIVNNENSDEDDTSLESTIKWKLQKLAQEVIHENKEELKPIIRDKVFRCCNETVLIAFLSDIVRQMNLDKAVKKIIQESEGEKI